MSLRVEKEQYLCLITLNRPEVYNSLNREIVLSLREELERLADDKSVRAVIITGEGEKAFCAGADLKERQTMTPEQVLQFLKTLQDTLLTLERLPKPVIAAINGVAFGGGTELALACDLRIMSRHAKMGLTETSLGIIPGGGGTQRLPRLIGKGKAKELIYTARHVDAEEALAIGLVNQVVEPAELLDAARRLAADIAKNAPLAIAQAKYAIDHGLEVDLVTGLAIETNAYQVLIPTKDRLEGLKAFQERRKPNYRGE
ncbi:MAG: enoyl-CoA hydratase [Bacillus thermozeamaize]|uniref:Enoyl-CoA hydratase n=1 Tax=Bacillus thermozeamaize TaxID=230954 RepID=A0A1Y3PS12_9BACI|nr:MAG: enoyl-CoA hydratase [Bacillus thermozeamaize]